MAGLQLRVDVLVQRDSAVTQAHAVTKLAEPIWCTVAALLGTRIVARLPGLGAASWPRLAYGRQHRVGSNEGIDRAAIGFAAASAQLPKLCNVCCEVAGVCPRQTHIRHLGMWF